MLSISDATARGAGITSDITALVVGMIPKQWSWLKGGYHRDQPVMF